MFTMIKVDQLQDLLNDYQAHVDTQRAKLIEKATRGDVGSFSCLSAAAELTEALYQFYTVEEMVKWQIGVGDNLLGVALFFESAESKIRNWRGANSSSAESNLDETIHHLVLCECVQRIADYRVYDSENHDVSERQLHELADAYHDAQRAADKEDSWCKELCRR